VILTLHTCGQRSSMHAESKRRALTFCFFRTNLVQPGPEKMRLEKSSMVITGLLSNGSFKMRPEFRPSRILIFLFEDHFESHLCGNGLYEYLILKCRGNLRSRSVHHFGTCKKNAAAQCRLPTNFVAAKHLCTEEVATAQLHSFCKYQSNAQT